MPPQPCDIHQVAAPQFGAISRRQLLALGAEPSWCASQVRIGRWQRLYPGVYLTHGGPVRWLARASGALLYAGRSAALSHGAAAYAHEQTTTPPRLIDVSVPASRRLAPQQGLLVHHRRSMPTAWGRPLAVNPGDTVLDLAERASSHEAVVEIVCNAMRHRTPLREIRSALARRARLRNRDLLVSLLAEVADGVESPLELRYRRDVERRHRLPRAELQVRERAGAGWIRADVVYRRYALRVELDGWLAHPGGRTDEDTWRDNVVLLEHGDITLRYRWRHVAGSPCRTAQQVTSALRAGGWTGRPARCGTGCDVATDVATRA